MKKVIICSAVLFSLLFSNCKKENESDLENNLNDNVVYTEVLPVIEITSVDSLIPHGSGCGNIPSPSDSTASVSLDINNDGASDFTLTCSSWFDFVSASGPCANYNTKITISGTSTENQIAIAGNYTVVDSLELNDTVDNSLSWTQHGTLMMSSAQVPFSYNFSGYKYIGLRIKQGQVDRFAWVLLNKDGYKISIISYAINLTENKPIKAGQID